MDRLTVQRLILDDLIAILVSRSWFNRVVDDRKFIHFLRCSEDEPISVTSTTAFRAPSLVQVPVLTSNPTFDEKICRLTGSLSRGRTEYYVELILHTDTFKARSPLFSKGLVGGIYMSPSCVHVKARRSQVCTRWFSLPFRAFLLI